MKRKPCWPQCHHTTQQAVEMQAGWRQEFSTVGAGGVFLGERAGLEQCQGHAPLPGARGTSPGHDWLCPTDHHRPLVAPCTSPQCVTRAVQREAGPSRPPRDQAGTGTGERRSLPVLLSRVLVTSPRAILPSISAEIPSFGLLPGGG